MVLCSIRKSCISTSPKFNYYFPNIRMVYTPPIAIGHFIVSMFIISFKQHTNIKIFDIMIRDLSFLGVVKESTYNDRTLT